MMNVDAGEATLSSAGSVVYHSQQEAPFKPCRRLSNNGTIITNGSGGTMMGQEPEVSPTPSDFSAKSRRAKLLAAGKMRKSLRNLLSCSSSSKQKVNAMISDPLGFQAAAAEHPQETSGEMVQQEIPWTPPDSPVMERSPNSCLESPGKLNLAPGSLPLLDPLATPTTAKKSPKRVKSALMKKLRAPVHQDLSAASSAEEDIAGAAVRKAGDNALKSSSSGVKTPDHSPKRTRSGIGKTHGLPQAPLAVTTAAGGRPKLKGHLRQSLRDLRGTLMSTSTRDLGGKGSKGAPAHYRSLDSSDGGDQEESEDKMAPPRTSSMPKMSRAAREGCSVVSAGARLVAERRSSTGEDKKARPARTRSMHSAPVGKAREIYLHRHPYLSPPHTSKRPLAREILLTPAHTPARMAKMQQLGSLKSTKDMLDAYAKMMEDFEESEEFHRSEIGIPKSKTKSLLGSRDIERTS